MVSAPVPTMKRYGLRVQKSWRGTLACHMVWSVAALLCVVASHEGDRTAFVHVDMPAASLVRKLHPASSVACGTKPEISNLCRQRSKYRLTLRELRASSEGKDDTTAQLEDVRTIEKPSTATSILNATMNAVAGTASSIPGVVGNMVRRAQTMRSSFPPNRTAGRGSSLSTPQFPSINWTTVNFARQAKPTAEFFLPIFES
jgi:hypothetical protein